MRWLSPHDAEKLTGFGEQEPQAFLFYCGHGDLTSSLPVLPRHISTDEGVPTPTNEWVVFLGDRPVVIQQEQLRDQRESNSVTVLTPFADSPAAGGWSSLRDLRALPLPIQPTRPLFIQSLSTSREHGVLRPNKRGWNDIVYLAACRAEAEGLLGYLRVDPWNGPCFIGTAEQAGRWAIIAPNAGEEQTLGCYPEVDAALRVASEFSRARPQDVLVVRDLSGRRSSNEYRVSRGHLEGSLRSV